MLSFFVSGRNQLIVNELRKFMSFLCFMFIYSSIILIRYNKCNIGDAQEINMLVQFIVKVDLIVFN